MVASTSARASAATPAGVAIIGNSPSAIQAAYTLAQIGIPVKLVTSATSLGGEDTAPTGDRRYLWPLLVRVASHPLIIIHSGSDVHSVGGKPGSYTVATTRRPRYVHQESCTSCTLCQAECSVRITTQVGGEKVRHTAIHPPMMGGKAIPSTYVIDKNGLAPCRAACPLGINVQGFVSLLANGKVDKALALINDAAPFAATLGRVCRHPCEQKCSRGKLDGPVFIRALHRYAADNATSAVVYPHKPGAESHPERVAIVGAGPAGLTAAWELARRGYSPVVFEGHGVVGGMLATGIPRFRLPREVREKEIESIKAMGVDIRTGITVGRDVTFAYLKERGYKAFFLAIGAHQNNRLNIPGEDTDGVVDCISLLLTLNLMRDAFVGHDIVVIGDGNSAIDSARAAKRRNQGTVRILSWTIPEEITATEEEVQEALDEGVTIEYRTAPAEILSSGGKVTGVRCQRTRLTDEVMPNGRHRPVPVPGTDFIIEADHVVVAIGQTPNTRDLNMEGLAVNPRTGVVSADPLTLETSVPGVFAGGDCITGPNNVVQAMAAGLRAAESIDRYLGRRDLAAGRSLETPATAEIDVKTVEATPYERAIMPAVLTQQRMGGFEETTTGLPAAAAQREAQRCLNCALCSECLECTRVCETGAVFHDDTSRRLELGAQVVLRFPDNNGGNDGLIEGMAAALKAVADLKKMGAWQSRRESAPPKPAAGKLPVEAGEGRRIGVFLCRCGGGIDSVIDFGRVTRGVLGSPDAACVQEIAEACTESGARQITERVAESRLDGLVLAACRCCNLGQVCYTCSDRRQLCRDLLDRYLDSDTVTRDFVNIREQCAFAHKDDRDGATGKALELISAAVAWAQRPPPTAPPRHHNTTGVVVLGDGQASVSAANALASLGYEVEMIAHRAGGANKGVTTHHWPAHLELRGSPGSYELVLGGDGAVETVLGGAVLVDTAAFSEKARATGLLERIVSRAADRSQPDDLMWETTLAGAPGLFLLPAGAAGSRGAEEKRGLAAAARVAAYLEQSSIGPRAVPAVIDSRLCRGCGDCAAVCPYIEMRQETPDKALAYVHEGLCLGCGACVSSCPAGAITQPNQSDEQIIATVRTLLRPRPVRSEVGYIGS